MVSALEIGVAAAAVAGVANYLVLRRTGALARQPRSGQRRSGQPRSGQPRSGQPWLASADASSADSGGADATQLGHVIYLDPWAGETPRNGRSMRGPSSLP
jgi:hypothetical protein